MIPSQLTAIPTSLNAGNLPEPSASTTEGEKTEDLTLLEGTYNSRDTVLIAVIPPHPNYPLAPSTNVLDTNHRPSTVGLRLSGHPRFAEKTTLPGFTDGWQPASPPLLNTEILSKPKSQSVNGSARFKSLASGNLKAYVGGTAHVVTSPTVVKETEPVKKKKPKTNLLKSNSSFISKVATHDSLSKHLDKIDAGSDTVFVNNSRALFWYDLSTAGQAEQLSKILFTKAHPLCHDVNDITRSSSHLDLIVGFSTADVFWYEPLSQRYSHINKNGIINPSAISSVKWLPGSESVFVAAHMDGNIILYDKEREDAPVSWDEESQPRSPVLKNGSRQPRLLIRKSVGSPNQKTNPIAVYKTTRRQLTDLKCSSDGRFVAVTSEDGTLRVADLLRETLIDLYSSYFGGLTCLAWSSDNKYIVTGGQDDFVSLWSFEERAIVARCDGHRSWVTAVAFDPWRCDDQNYRFASVGEDRRLVLWDFSVGMTQQPRTPSIRPSISSSVVRAAEPSQDNKAPNGLEGLEMKVSLESTDNDSISHAVEARDQVAILPPVMSKEIDEHPLAWVGFTRHYLALACNQGHIRTFERPNINA